jgi:hypothetical protein
MSGIREPAVYATYPALGSQTRLLYSDSRDTYNTFLSFPLNLPFLRGREMTHPTMTGTLL